MKTRVSFHFQMLATFGQFLPSVFFRKNFTLCACVSYTTRSESRCARKLLSLTTSGEWSLRRVAWDITHSWSSSCCCVTSVSRLSAIAISLRASASSDNCFAAKASRRSSISWRNSSFSFFSLLSHAVMQPMHSSKRNNCFILAFH